MIREATPGDDAQLPLTLGTAGHVDHGKTALVEYLTGKNTDRLAEERERGISIELGFAGLTLPGGRQLSIVDVPGHERFVSTMVAGASGIDIYLLCIAADDGVMPQTREHAAVLRQLGVDLGVVAITKADRADPTSALRQAAELAPGVPAIAVSGTTGAGIGDLVQILATVVECAERGREREGAMRLHVDRSFTVRGIGTVLTGTLRSGSIAVGDQVAIEPEGRAARVRSVQVHDSPVPRAVAGQRVAIGLAGIGWREVNRGDVVSDPAAALRPTYRLDAAVSLEPDAPPLQSSNRIQVHHGTRHSPARMVPLDGDPNAKRYVQLRLERPLMAVTGDRLVLRQLAPPGTIGGGIVLDAHPRRHSGSEQILERLQAIDRGDHPPDLVVPAAVQEHQGISAVPEPSEAAWRLLNELLGDGPSPRTDTALAHALKLETSDARRCFAQLERIGQAVRVGANQHFSASALAGLAEHALMICDRDGGATIAAVRDEMQTSRKYAQAILEHLDRTKQTRRLGNVHVRRRSRQKPKDRTSGEGVEPSKRGAAPPLQF